MAKRVDFNSVPTPKLGVFVKFRRNSPSRKILSNCHSTAPISRMAWLAHNVFSMDVWFDRGHFKIRQGLAYHVRTAESAPLVQMNALVALF